ncbi:glucosyltransferase [Flammula alnicola]|nr:glucosyltransferase [Flammula alnicola]
MASIRSSGSTTSTLPVSNSWLSWDILPSEWDILWLSTALKLLLFPSYRSTDFEVHRNWLAITHTLPISKWYYDTTSEWTLDYPPFFAYFEKLLSIPAFLIDPRIVDLNNLNYDEWSVIAYQRTTVILTELVLGIALLKFIRGSIEQPIQRIVSASIFLHPGFLIVDHIHFQYNGFMYGILLWSILMARNVSSLQIKRSLIIFFHISLTFSLIKPAYFVYLLRSFCISPTGQVDIKNFLSLANAVIAVFVVSLGPFALMGQIPQLLSRLFPFTRGLNHAYWAPNFWALVTAADRVLLKYVQLTESGIASSSRGLVGDTVFAVLPNVKPIHTFIITVAFQLIWLVKLWRNPTYKSFLTALTLSGWTSFLFGWHVHEKAVLLVLIPLSLLAAERHAYFRTFVLASVAGIFSLFPLIFTPTESIIKVVYSTIWIAAVYIPLSRRVYEYPKSIAYVIMDTLEKLYLSGFPLLLLFVSAFPLLQGQSSVSSASTTVESCVSVDAFSCPEPQLGAIAQSGTGASAMQFLPLMATSIYCAIGLVWSFMRLGFIYLHEETTYQGQLSEIK